MKALYDLKEMLCDELEEYGKKGELSAGTLDIVDKLTHTIKNLDKIIETLEEEDGEYSGNMMPDYRGGMSYARGRRNAKRDARGRYSSEGYSRTGDLVDRLRDLAADAPDERSRMEIHKLVSKMEQM